MNIISKMKSFKGRDVSGLDSSISQQHRQHNCSFNKYVHTSEQSALYLEVCQGHPSLHGRWHDQTKELWADKYSPCFI